MCRLLCPPCRQMGTAGHSHLHATDSAKLLVFSSSAENRRVVLSSPPALGAGGPEFKSRRPDQNISRVFFSILKAPFTSNPICGILADRRSGFRPDPATPENLPLFARSLPWRSWLGVEMSRPHGFQRSGRNAKQQQRPTADVPRNPALQSGRRRGRRRCLALLQAKEICFQSGAFPA